MPVLDVIPVKSSLPNGPRLLHQDLRLSIVAVLRDLSRAVTEGPERFVGHAAEESLLMVCIAGSDRVRVFTELLGAAASASVLVVD